jgi:hypothetical protein
LASKPPQEEAFFREVDEELRREQIETMWKRYGLYGVGVVLLLLAALAAFLFWRAHVQKNAETHSEELSAALADAQAGRTTEAGKTLDTLVAEGGPPYRVAALFTKAALAAEKGDDKGAAAIYAGIAADAKAAQPYRDIALIRQTLIEYDRLPPQQVIDRLKPLTIESGPFFGTAGELSAIAMMRLNRPAEAGRLLAAVARDTRTPSTLRARAGRLAISLGADMSAKPADKD